MPVSFSFDGRIVVMRGAGEYTVDDLKRTILQARGHPDCPPAPLMMFDLTDSASLGGRTAADVKQMAAFLGRERERFGAKLAMVVASDVAYGLMRMGAAHAEAGGVHPAVFRDREAARGWLLDADDGPPPP